MPSPYRYQHHDEDDVHHHDSLPPKANPKVLSIMLKAIIMTLITSLFFILLGLAALILLPFLFTSLHRHHNAHRHRRPDLSDGLSLKDLKRVPQFKLSKRVESQLGSESECVVCLDGFKQGQWCRVLAGCGHVFHRKCVDTWLVKVAACPICRTTVC